MNTTRLKKFATEARNKLRQGVLNKLSTLGFDSKGHAAQSPIEVAGGATWKDKPCTSAFYHSFKDLEKRIARHGVGSVVEEAAYTWFNRFMAIQIMAVNQLCDPVLRFVGSARTPMIVDEARQGHIPHMADDAHIQLEALLEDDTKTTEQFALLITAFCHNTPVINACFGDANSFTELLIPSNILAEDGFIDMINSLGGGTLLSPSTAKGDTPVPRHWEGDSEDKSVLSPSYYHSAELMGWLYQFYISERKDEVFAKKGKYNADDIPAATQIFTPNWIVKYMVQNAIGGVLGGKEELPEDQRKYYVDAPDGQEPAAIVSDIEELRAGDLGCGSGHILGEMFDLLYEIYIGEGYTRREAIECIFRKNIVGIDIDNRACQLARFALLLRACQKDNSLIDASILPRIIEAPYPFSDVYPHDLRGYLPHFFLGTPSDSLFDELTECFKLIDDAKELGSIIKFNLSERNREILANQVAEWESQYEIPHGIKIALPYMDFILALTDKYDALVMNPPYMGSGSFTDVLANYTKKNYPDAKADLMTVFMEVCIRLCVSNGFWSMINLPSWMFISSFEALRRKLLSSQHICSLLHLGRGIFGSDFGSVAFVIRNCESQGKGVYRRLFKEHVQVRSIETIQNLFLDSNYGCHFSDQKDYNKIPGSPIGYWTSQDLLSAFENYAKLVDKTTCAAGVSSGDNGKYLKLWFEVSFEDIAKNIFTEEAFRSSCYKYAFCNKGGEFRKWYGNNEYVALWCKSHEFHRNGATYKHLLFVEGITWSAITSSKFSARYYPNGFIFDHASPSMFPVIKEQLFPYLGFLNSIAAREILSLINPTINMGADSLRKLPINDFEFQENHQTVKNCVSISKEDWDAHETSWDFRQNELVRLRNEGAAKSLGNGMPEYMANYNLEQLVQAYIDYWNGKFETLHRNEEELNRRFIDIYGLQDELTPDVPANEVTILQNGEITILEPSTPDNPDDLYVTHTDTGAVIRWNKDVIIKQLISYLVGCMMGRYRLDRPGLAIAHPNETPEEIAEYPLGGRTLLSSNNNPFLEWDKDMKQGLAGNLPHWHQDGKLQFVTFRLADSLPKEKRDELLQQKEAFLTAHPLPWDEATEKEYKMTFSDRMQQWLDSGYGSCVLKDHEVAEIVEKCLYHYNGVQYIIHSYVIMPNHVHVLVETMDDYELCDILKSWKGVSARRINQKNNATGSLWMEESFDRMIRNSQHYDNVIKYIDKNIRQGGVKYWNGGQECPPSQYFWIDSDGIIPLMSEDCGFHDNAVSRIAAIVRQVFGDETQAQNLNYIESCLGESIEQYFIKNFWKDHKKMYQNRPIYWLFASKKGSFQVLVYVHRMNVATVERIRSRYLLPYIERLNKRIEDLEAREALLSTKERKQLQDLRKQVEECTEYHNRLAVVAERGIVPDLDAGIIANHALYGDVVAKLK